MSLIGGIIFFILFFAGTANALEPVGSGNSVDEITALIRSRKPIPYTEARPAYSRPELNKIRNLGNGTRVQAKPISSRAQLTVDRRPLVSDVAGNRISSKTYLSSSARPIVKQTLISNRIPPSSTGLSSDAQPPKIVGNAARPPVKAKALFCIDCSSNKIKLAENISEPLPIASITKLLTAMIVVEEMDLDQVLEVPADITEVERHKVGIRPGDMFTVRDLLHGMLIESGNDCAEALARAYPKGGRDGFIAAMNKKALQLGAPKTVVFTPSGLDMKITLGRKNGRALDSKVPNRATAEDVAVIARHAFNNPLIAKICAMKTYTMRTRNTTPRDYPLVSNDKLLSKNLPIAGAKTGFTNMAGKCIVALFKDEKAEHMIVVLNTPHHFKAAEKIYRWANRTF